MRRAQANMPRRPVSTAGAVAKSRKEAAIQLVRLEFDLNRVETAIAQAEQRARAHRAEREELTRRRDALMARLGDCQKEV